MTTVHRIAPRRIIFFVAYNLVATAAVLMLLEIGIRIFAPSIRPEATSYSLVTDSLYGSSAGLRSGASGYSGGAQVSVDALGFWKYSAQTDSLQDGWLLLGDSVTLGIGIEPDSTFAGRMAGHVHTYAVHNPSWIGYSSTDYLNIARAFLRDHIPSALQRHPIRRVTIFWTLNDIYSNCDIGLPPGQSIRNRGSLVLGWLRRNYHTYSWLKAFLFDRAKDYYEFDHKFYQQTDARYLSALSDLDSLQGLCLQNNVRLDVVLLPYEYQLRTHDSTVFAPQHMLAHDLNRRGIEYHDASPAPELQSADSKSLYLLGDGIHFSSKGHRSVFQFLTRVDQTQ
jgi:lysophospholipase L1-like esterase